jgi:hypothetical protein
MTPPTDPHGWPEHARFDCAADDGTKHTIIVRKEPPQQVRTLDGVHTVGGGHLAHFTSKGLHVNPSRDNEGEFTVAETNQVLRKI